MFRSIVESVTKGFARWKKPAVVESPSVAPFPEPNGNGTPDNASVPHCNPSVPEQEILSPELNGNGKSENIAIPDRGPSVLEREIRLRAYLKWEAAGKPKADDYRFWLEARKELLE